MLCASVISGVHSSSYKALQLFASLDLHSLQLVTIFLDLALKNEVENMWFFPLLVDVNSSKLVR